MTAVVADGGAAAGRGSGAPPRPSIGQSLGLALLVLLLGAAFSIVSALQLRGQAQERLQLRFQNEADERFEQVHWRIRSIEQKLSLLRNALSHAPDFDEAHFRSLSEPLLGDVLGFTWAPRVPHTWREDFEREASAALGQPFRILSPWGEQLQPAPPADEYFPVRYLVTPFVNGQPLGFDLGQHAQRRAALERAWRRGTLVATEVLGVRGLEAETPGALLIAPVFAAAQATADEAPLKGFIVASVGLETLLLEGFQAMGGRSLHLALHTAADEGPVFHHGVPAPGIAALGRTLHIGDTEWRLQLAPGADFIRANPERSWLLLLVFGLLLSLLVAGGLFMALGQRQRALALVDERTAQLRDSERRWHFALESAREGVWDWDFRSGTIYFSIAGVAMLGYREGELGDTPAQWAERIHPEDFAAYWHDLQCHLRGETPYYEHEYRARCRDGRYTWLLDRGQVLERGPDGAPLRMIGTHLDIDRQKRMEFALRRANAQLNSLLDAATRVAIIATDPQGVIQTFNRGAELMLGYAADAVIGRETPMLIHDPEEVAARGRELSARLERPVTGFDIFVCLLREERRYDEREWTYIRKDGGRLTVSLVVTAMRDADERLIGYLALATDITASKQAEAELRKLAITDHLTGIFNRRYFQERLETEIGRARRYESPLSLIMFDLDRFKLVNDRFGHECGDRVLRETCERVGQRLRRSDIFCRSGGEEFVVLCPETDREQAEALADLLLQRLRREAFAGVGVVTASFRGGGVPPGGQCGYLSGPRRSCHVPGQGRGPQPGECGEYGGCLR